MIYLDNRNTNHRGLIGMQKLDFSLVYLHWSKDKAITNIGLFWPKNLYFKLPFTENIIPIGPTNLVEWCE